MAIEQPLTSFSDRVSDAWLESVDKSAPTIRAAHKALDACADESGPLRYERALRADPKGGQGAFFLLAETPSPALAVLFERAPAARQRFKAHLGMTDRDAPLSGTLRLASIDIAPCRIEAPMDVFLSMLERDPQTTPSSLETLFEELEEAHEKGLIRLEADSLSLTNEGRAMVQAARDILSALDQNAIREIDLHAQEVADGRMSLKSALDMLGNQLGLSLPAPGQPDLNSEVVIVPDSGGRIDASAFEPLLGELHALPSGQRMAVAVLALHGRLVEWGLSSTEAASVIRHDIRCLRALGASFSHGPLALDEARRQAEEQDLSEAAEHAKGAISVELLAMLCGPRRVQPEPFPEPDSEAPTAPGPDELLHNPRKRGLLAWLLGFFRKGS